VIIRGLDARVATGVHEEIDQCRDDRTPGAPNMAGNEVHRTIDDAFDPENLTGDKNHEQAQEEQVKEDAELVGMYDVEASTGKDQQRNDTAPMTDDASAKSGETHHIPPFSLR